MPKLYATDDEEEDDDGPTYGQGDYDTDEDPTLPCPHCRRTIPEDTPRCPYCEQYLSREDAPWVVRPWWVVLGTALGLYGLYRGLMG